MIDQIRHRHSLNFRDMTGDFKTPTPAGWYPDPTSPPRQRYFDGVQWTEHYHYGAAGRLSPTPPPIPPAPTKPSAGWYADPDGLARRRYWDGHQWTTHYTDNEVAEPKATPWFVGAIGAILVLSMVFMAAASRGDDNAGAAIFWVFFGGFFAVSIWWGLRSSEKRRRRQKLQDQHSALTINAEIEDDAFRRGDDQRGMHGQYPPSA